MIKLPAFVSSGVLVIAFLSLSVSEAIEWYDAYDNGVKAVQQGQWTIAEQNLKDAKAQNPEQGKRVQGKNGSYMKYIPDYYLGVVYYNQRKYQDALAQFELAESLGLVQPGDSEFIRMTAMIQSARQQAPGPRKEIANEKQKQFDGLIAQANEALAAGNYAQARDLAGKAKALGVQQQQTQDLLNKINSAENAAAKEKEQEKQRLFASLLDESRQALAAKQYDKARDIALRAQALGIGQQNVSDLLNAIDTAEGKAKENQRLAEFNTLMAQANRALESAQYSRARDLTAKAKSTGVDPARASAFLKSIDLAEQESILEAALRNSDWTKAQASLAALENLNPGDPRIASFRERIERGLNNQNAEQLEEAALEAFYTGKYNESIALWERILEKENDSVVAHFYMGCSQATIGLLADEKEQHELLAKARTHFAAARRIQPGLIPDSKFISPGVLQIYKTAD